jgi:uncharacterized membrane protein (DUF485 family)
MPVKKKATKKNTRSISSVATSEAMSSEMSNDTKIIVVVLLLLFLYPIGIIFMWVWMKSWPVWAKILISIPFIFGIVCIIFGFTIIGWFIRNGNRYNSPMDRMQQERELPQMSGNTNNQFYFSPTPD